MVRKSPYTAVPEESRFGEQFLIKLSNCIDRASQVTKNFTSHVARTMKMMALGIAPTLVYNTFPAQSTRSTNWPGEVVKRKYEDEGSRFLNVFLFGDLRGYRIVLLFRTEWRLLARIAETMCVGGFTSRPFLRRRQDTGSDRCCNLESWSDSVSTIHTM